MFRLRSLSGWLAFDAAARHSSLTLAANELGRTQSAVSQQVKALEQELGFDLFVRRPREILLTPEGKAVASAVRGAFEGIEKTVTAQQVSDDPNMLRVTTYQSFAIEWLIPRLPRFYLKHPHIHVHVNADDKRFDLRAEGFDLAIRVGLLPKYEELMRGEFFVPVYATSLTGGKKIGLDDIQNYQHLAHTHANFWPEWIAENKVKGCADPNVAGFSHSGLLVQAAAAGGGIALAPLITAADAIASGRLVCIPSIPLATEHAYYIAAAKTPEPEKVSLFRAWIREELAQMDRDMAPYTLS
jgi:LysR family glycine cleavage system transcriptional activator